MRNLLTPFVAATAALFLGACSSEPDAQSADPGAAAAADPEGADVEEAPDPDPDADSASGTDDPETATTHSDDMEDAPTDAATIYAGTMKDLAGNDVDMSQFRGKVVLFVNVASQCGYTPQYSGLQKLHEEMGGDEFVVVGVPSNDFGGQEPGSADEIREFCSTKYSVTFPMMEKVATKGDDAAPLYSKLAGMTGESPGWNFCKYVVSKDGTRAKFFKSGVKPESTELREAIRSFME